MKLTKPQAELLNKLKTTQLKPPYSANGIKYFGSLRVVNELVKKGFMSKKRNDFEIWEYKLI